MAVASRRTATEGGPLGRWLDSAGRQSDGAAAHSEIYRERRRRRTQRSTHTMAGRVHDEFTVMMFRRHLPGGPAAGGAARIQPLQLQAGRSGQALPGEMFWRQWWGCAALTHSATRAAFTRFSQIKSSNGRSHSDTGIRTRDLSLHSVSPFHNLTLSDCIAFAGRPEDRPESEADDGPVARGDAGGQGPHRGVLRAGYGAAPAPGQAVGKPFITVRCVWWTLTAVTSRSKP